MTKVLGRLFIATSAAILLSGSTAAYAESPPEPSSPSGYCAYVTIDNPPFWLRVCTP